MRFLELALDGGWSMTQFRLDLCETAHSPFRGARCAQLTTRAAFRGNAAGSEPASCIYARQHLMRRFSEFLAMMAGLPLLEIPFAGYD